ncbi:unnamed protein product [Zymoseptoria tritici ST99CH_1A5]|uniref:Zn(2)-C6 fungal-type domain-containing protein n=1 Tax=Zymoseptoria tritici ST99CH_1A5 TaxID=1276529 RepID=A0A1Y6LK48_ZYMTR|nr:unnamed protein product [Zymoseptoria tritici ST99CH_3D1]SMY22861.1 unnamed protein product [Zymoseptoria tritici ST99CH_1A5]
MSSSTGPRAGPSAAPGRQPDDGLVQDGDVEVGVDASASANDADELDTERPRKSMKRPQIKNACWTCRGDKVKCSGHHPICARCSHRKVPCSYDVPEENMTKMQHLRTKISDAEKRLELVNTIFDILQKGSDEAAAEALARLRIGQSVDEVVNYMVAARANDQTGSSLESPETIASG